MLVQEGGHVDSKDDRSLKATTTPAAKRGRPRKVVQEILDQDESTPPVPVIAKASAKKKRTTPIGSNDSRVRVTRKAVAAVQNSVDDDEEKDKENTTVSGDVEDWEQTQAQGVTVKVRVSRTRGAAGGERVDGTAGKTRTGSGRATRSASKAVKVEVVDEAIVEPVRNMRTRAKSRTG